MHANPFCGGFVTYLDSRTTFAPETPGLGWPEPDHLLLPRIAGGV